VRCADFTCSSRFAESTLDSTGLVGRFSSLAIGTDGLPVISYADETNGALKFVHCTNVFCSFFDPPLTLDTSQGDHTSIAIGTDGFPVISYGQNPLKFVHCTSVDCLFFDTPLTLDNKNNVGAFTSIAIGSDTFPVISYLQFFPSLDLKVLHCTDTTCSSISSFPSSPSSIGSGELSIYQTAMNFRPSESGVQRACLPVEDVGDFYYATWDDWFNTDQNYDLFLYNAAMDTLLDFSNIIQDGVGIDNPIETIFPVAPLPPVTSCIVVASLSSTQDHFFHIDTEGNVITNSADLVRAGSLDTPADATGALAVGAIDQVTDIIEPFSSSGPTDDARNKPEICGPDNTFTHQPGLNPFFGTSSATPHVAGAAALLIEKHPTIPVDQLKNFLTVTARFDASYSVNNLCGENSGAIDLSLVPGPPPPGTDVIIPIGTGFPSCETTSSCFLPSPHVINQGEQVTWYNDDVVSHTVTSGTPGGGPDGIFESFSILSGESFSHTFQSSRTVDYFSLLQPWMTGQVTVNAVPCLPPGSGDWTITSSCTLSSSSTAPGNVIIQNGAVLTIPAGRSLDIDFVNNFLRIEFPSGVLIKAGGSLT